MLIHGSCQMQYSTVRDGPAGRARSAANAPQQAGQRQVILRCDRMRNDHVRHELHQRVVGRPRVFIEIDDDVGRRQRTDLVEIDVLGAADLGNGGDNVLWVDAETCAADELRRQAQVAQQFGNRWHERDDARTWRGPVYLAQCVGQFSGTGCHVKMSPW
jgi:hypothetical protein